MTTDKANPSVSPTNLSYERFVVLGLLLIVCSCGGTPASQTATSESGSHSGMSIPDSTQPGAVRADLPEIVARAQRAMVLAERAGNVLIAQCMEDNGFEFFGPVDGDVGLTVSDLSIGSLTPEVAETEGYGPYLYFSDGPDPTDALLEAGREYYESLSPDDQQRYAETLWGGGDEESVLLDSGVAVNMGGCLGDSRRELMGAQVLDVYETFNTVQFLQVDVSEDRDVQASERAWEACMRESGYRFERPPEAVEAGLLMRGDAVEPSDEERALAVADAECRNRSGVIRAVAEAFARMNQEAVQENEQLLASWTEMERFVLEEAGEVLGVRLTQDP